MADKPALTLPSVPPLSLTIEWLDEGSEVIEDYSGGLMRLLNPLQAYPNIEGEPTVMTVRKTRALTKPGALKTALEVTLEFKEAAFKFEPGDAINIICPNSLLEVNQLLERLGLNTNTNANRTIRLRVKPKATGNLPAFLPAIIAVRDAFLYYLDIRTCPTQTFLRLLAEFTSDPNEKSQLVYLSSSEGESAFEETVQLAALSLLDLLLTYSSCQPPLEALLEHLPRLSPRTYSISSSPLANDNSFTFAFDLLSIPKQKGRHHDRLGVCSGWLYKKCRRIWFFNPDIDIPIKELSLEENSADVLVYRRKSPIKFRLPANPEIPVIMVATGTGVAPFVGFLQHREKLKVNGFGVGPMSLYFVCGHKDKDFLHREEFEGFKEGEAGVLAHFYPVFSGLEPNQHVQHKLEENREQVVKTLFEDGGYLYVCGEAHNIAEDVRATLIKIVKTVKRITDHEARELVDELIREKRYLENVWT